MDLTVTDNSQLVAWAFCAGLLAFVLAFDKIFQALRRRQRRQAARNRPRLVIVESPYAGDVERNLRYVRAAMADCLRRGEAPYASHALYTQEGVLDDRDPVERVLGIEAGLAWGSKAAATVVYTDLGMSTGMLQGVQRAWEEGRDIEYRQLPGWEAGGKERAACQGG